MHLIHIELRSKWQLISMEREIHRELLDNIHNIVVEENISMNVEVIELISLLNVRIDNLL